jgi:hypothetical protein
MGARREHAQDQHNQPTSSAWFQQPRGSIDRQIQVERSELPYYVGQRPDALGYVANPAGSSFVDDGVGNFLTKGYLLSQPSALDSRWLRLAPDNQARFRGQERLMGASKNSSFSRAVRI